MRPAVEICTLLDTAIAAETPEAWHAFAETCRQRLSRKHCGAMATVLLDSLSDNHRQMIVSAICKHAGYPLPAFFDPKTEADLWAENASVPELRAWIFASFNALDPKTRASFTKYVQSQATSREKETTP